MPAEIGRPAPGFTLRDQNNQDVSLSALRGKNVLLIFYPFAFTRVCEGELCAVRDDLPKLQSDDVQVLTISVDTPYAHKVWAQQQGFEFPLLSDFWPHGAVSREYGCFDEKRGCATRGSFVVDRDGILRWEVRNAIPDARNHAAYLEVLAGL